MSDAQRLSLMETTLGRAAERLGDVTPAAMQLFYARYPDARAAFEMHGIGNPARLEGEMVQQALYCLMYWFDSPGEIEIVLLGSVPHHKQTLKVPPEWYSGLIESVMDVVAGIIPPERDEERENWATLRRELTEVIATGGSFA